MTSKLAEQIAHDLLAAYRTGTPIEPPTTSWPGMTLDDAYAAQLGQIKVLTSGGRKVVGHKIGLTSAAMQDLLGVTEPDYGHLLDDMVYVDHGSGATVGMDRFIQPRVEPEIGFVLSRPLRGPGVDLKAAQQAVESAFPALEVVDSRIRDWKIGLLDTIADNASSGAVVIGADRVAVDSLDLLRTTVTLRCNSDVVGTGDGAAVMGNPLAALAWLANTLGTRGIALEPGHLVIPGAMCAMVPVEAGDRVTAEFTGLGSVSAVFVGDAK